MPLDHQKLLKPVRKLRKQINNLAAVPSPEQVHDLRTNCRKLEAILHALRLDGTKKGFRLLGSVKPIRRIAGKVRDMDVLTGLVASIPGVEKNESCVRILEHLGTRRFKLIKKLIGSTQSEGEQVRSSLKQFNAHLKKRLRLPQNDDDLLIDPVSISLQLFTSLAAWRKIDLRSLHAYRLKVKELRYVLQLATIPETPLFEALGEVKNTIGEWHDWCELEDIAADVVSEDRATRRQIHSIAQEKFARAIEITTQTHARYLSSAIRQHGKRRRGPVALKRAALNAVSKIAT